MLRSCLLSSFIIYLLIVKSYGDSLGVFDDSVLFDVSWPGLLPEDSPLTIEVKTVNCMCYYGVYCVAES